MKEVKCEHCGSWTDGNNATCTSCYGVLNEKTIEEKRLLSMQEPAKIPLIQIDPKDVWYVKAIKSIFRFGQIVFLIIISTLAYMSSSLAHG
jgi:hypothetical protein